MNHRSLSTGLLGVHNRGWLPARCREAMPRRGVFPRRPWEQEGRAILVLSAVMQAVHKHARRFWARKSVQGTSRLGFAALGSGGMQCEKNSGILHGGSLSNTNLTRWGFGKLPGGWRHDLGSARTLGPR